MKTKKNQNDLSKIPNKEGIEYYSKCYGKLISESTWIRVKTLLKDANLPCTEEYVREVASIRKYVHILTPDAFLAFLKQRKKFRSLFKHGNLKGLSAIYALEHIAEAKVTQSSYSRWFQNIGGFKKCQEYSAEQLEHMLVNLYYVKNANSPNNRILRKQSNS